MRSGRVSAGPVGFGGGRGFRPDAGIGSRASLRCRACLRRGFAASAAVRRSGRRGDRCRGGHYRRRSRGAGDHLHDLVSRRLGRFRVAADEDAAWGDRVRLVRSLVHLQDDDRFAVGDQLLEGHLDWRSDLGGNIAAQLGHDRLGVLEPGDRSLLRCRNPEVDLAAARIGEGDDVAQDGALTALRARALMEDLVRGVALEASGFDRIARRRREGADAVELIAGQEGLEGGERHLRQEDLGRAVADAEIRLPCRVLLEAVRIRALDAVHAAGILALGAAEEACRRAAIGRRQQVGYFERVEMRILGVGDLGLPAEAESLHGDAMRRIDVGADDEGAVLGEDLVGAKHVSGRADLTAAKAILRHTQQQEQVLHEAERWCPRGRWPECEIRTGR